MIWPVQRLLLVANPTAQSGKNRARIERAQELFRLRHGVAATLFPTLPAGRTIGELTARLRQEDDEVVVAMGGDGTFREVATAILESGRAETIRMGMLPTGTANDQGKSFGMEATDAALPANVATVAEGVETRLDAGRIESLDASDRVTETAMFFDSAGWGLSARVLAVRNRDRDIVSKLGALKELYRDQLVYAGALLRTFLEAQVVDDKFSAVIEADGVSRTLHGLTDLIVKGTRVYAGAWVFDRDSRHDDGKFELITFRGKREWMSKAIVDLDGNPITEEILNTVGVEHSRPIRAARFEISLAPEGEVPIFAQLDGEEFGGSYQSRIAILERPLRLIVPG